MNYYPPFRKENIKAYLSVLLIWTFVSLISAIVYTMVTTSPNYIINIVWAAITSTLGMAIMFGASILNLRKLTPGFKRLAEGETNPNIPPVWCPVLTAATNAAIDLASKKNIETIKSH